MINNEKMQIALKSYKDAFSERWKDKKFKWKAVKWFQEHWKINAENFSEMFAVSTKKVPFTKIAEQLENIAGEYFKI
ncbi:MAG: hypothetical protein K1W24_07290 [Lachnospiraceae bacterium]